MPRLIDAWDLEARVRNFHGRGKKTMLEFIHYEMLRRKR